MESLHPRALNLLQNLRKPSFKMSRRYLDKLHGEHLHMSNDPTLDIDTRAIHADLAKAVEIRFKELDTIQLLKGD